MKLRRDVDALRAMLHTLAATGAVVGLPQLRHRTIVAYQIGAPHLFISLVLAALWHIALVDALVIMQQYSRNVDSVGARHAILAVVARNRRVFQHQLRRLFQIVIILLSQRDKRRICKDIVLKMLHISHTAQYGEHILVRTGKAERPRSHAVLRTALFQTRHDMLRHVRQTAAQQGLHDYGRYSALDKLAIEIFGIDIRSRRMPPVNVVELYLHEVPMHLVVHGKHFVEHVHRTVERESEIADAPCFTLLNQEFYHSILDITLAECLYASVADGMQQVIVDIVRLQVLERLAVHSYRILARIVGEVRQFRGQIIRLSRITAQRYAGGFLRPSLNIHRRCVEIVHAVLYRVIHQSVHRVLIYNVAVAVGRRHCRPAHASVAEQRHAVAFRRCAVSHFVCRNLACGFSRCRFLRVRRTSVNSRGRCRCADTYNLKEFTPAYVFFFAFHNAVFFILFCGVRALPRKSR